MGPLLKDISFSGFPKGGVCEGGDISIFGVVRAPVAIFNFGSDLCKNLSVYIGFNKVPHKNARFIIGARTTPIFEISPPWQTFLETLDLD